MNHSSAIGIRAFRVALVFVLGVALLTPILSADVATAMDEASKQEWQDDYRLLLRNKVRLERNVESARVNYMRANRRNYPRGEARQRIVIEGEEAERELAKVEREIEKLREDGRRAGALPSWFMDVEDEVAAYPEPAARADDEDVEDRAGRNPLYDDE